MPITVEAVYEGGVQGVAPEVLAVNALRERFLGPARRVQPQDERERRLPEAATDGGVALSHEAVGSEGPYEEWPTRSIPASWSAVAAAERLSPAARERAPGSRGLGIGRAVTFRFHCCAPSPLPPLASTAYSALKPRR